MTFIDVLTVIVLVLVAVLIVFLIVYLGKITSSVQGLQKNISDLSNRVDPLVTALTDLSLKLSDLSDQAQSQLETTKNIVFRVRDRVDTILGLEERIRTGIEVPVMGLINHLKAISNGVNTFLSYLKK